MNDMSITLDDAIDLSEACDIAGYSLRRMYDYIHEGVIKARQTPSGTWITTRQEAERLKARGRLKRGRKPKAGAA